MSVIQKNKKVRKWTVGIVLIFFILTQVLGGVFFYVKPATAQMVVTDPVTGAQTTIKNIKDFLKILVVNAGTMALINAATRFMQKVSYDLAVSLASGGSGQMPLFSTKGWGDYLGDAALDAAGEFIGSFGDMVGVDFCAPPNPRLGLTLQLQLAQTYADGLPPPSCPWSAIQSNWESFISEVQTEDFLREAASQFRIGYGAGTDLDLAISGYVGAFNVERRASDTAELTRQEGQGFLPSSEFISGKVKTPAEVIRQTSEIQTKGPVDAENLKWSLSGQALSAGAQGILTMMASTFVSTLLSKTMERIFSKGMYSLADLFPGGSDKISEEGTTWGGRRAAELAFADLLVPQIKEGGAYDILSDFIVCPEKFKGTNNCVMDGKFEAAVRQAQTGEALTIGEAIKQGYLHGEWPIYPPSNTAKNQDPNCYTYGYCYSNLVKLRKARIISIGWEIAAQSQTATEPVSLKEVVDRFHDCNAAGEADTEHKYCHLIDPDWILKAPAEQCRARVYGPLLQTTENSFRQETCVDSPTCLAEDDQGNCEGGWGYCTREKNIWRLDGDKCDAQYDTCRLLRRSDGQNVAYVTNTVDYGPPCTADDIGCRWYSDRQSKVGDEWQWQDTLTGSGTAARRNDRIFFNKNITQCDEPGCNEFLRTTFDTKLNLVSNSSFENFTDNPAYGSDTFEDWPYTGEASGVTYFGRTALRFIGTFERNIVLDQPKAGRTFVLSFYTKNINDTEVCTGSATFEGTNVALPASAAYQRITIEKTASGAGSTLNFRFSGLGNCLIDAVQLEEGTFASQYHEGWGKTGEALYLKTAPGYFACYDYTSTGALDKTNDAEQCQNYAKACEEKDVGCEQYRPTNGDPVVPGVANYPDDYCPAECAGYQTFKQVATDFEQDKFPVYFIPTTGRTCNAADVGCDQFTSLETEAVANFNYIRRCEKPSAGSAAFYTWEGSDTTGYQLKTWSLKMSGVVDSPISLSDPDGGRAPCTKLNPTDPTICADDGVTGVCTKTDTSTNPDCREFYDAAGKKHYRLYSKTIVATDDCRPYRKTVSTIADCGSSGGRWDTTKNECVYQIYLPESRSCSAAAVGCRAYRGNAGANTALIFSDDFDDGTPGDWSAGDISSESLVVGGKSLSLAAGGTTTKDVSASVRKGGIYTLSFWAKGSSRLDIKFSDADEGKEFSAAATNPTNLSFDWRYFSLGPVYVDWEVASSETLRITASGGTTPAYLDNIILREIQSYIYVVKNSWQTPVSCDRSFAVDTSVTEATACATSGGSWNVDRSECVLSALLPQAQLGCQSYTDRANRLHYLKSFSRLCPVEVAGCEKLLKTGNNSTATLEIFNTENDSDASLSEEERLSDNVTIPADSFSFIVVNDAYKCAAQNKGCAEFGSPTLDTAGNVKVDDEGRPVYDTVNLLADPARFDSATGRILCQVGFQGCEEYTTSQSGKLYFKNPEPRLCEWKDNVSISGQNVSGWFKKGSNPLEPCDPNNFSGGYYNIWKNGDANCTLPNVCNDTCALSSACTADAGCTCTSGSRTCTVKKGVTTCGLSCACTVPADGGTPGATATGKAGTTCTVAYNKRSCPYSGWVGECIPQADMCTKFVDPADTTNDPLGAAYYYINNDKISSGNCNGMVSQKDGCVLFNDTSDPQLDYNANATYAASEALVSNQGGLVAPIDCSQDPNNVYCSRCLKVMTFAGLPPAGGYTEYIFGNFCQASSECPADYQESTPAISESGGEGCVTVKSNQYSPGVGSGVPIRRLISIPLTAKIVFEPTLSSQINDSNRLVQVRRDRVCGEWLYCSGTNSTFDPQIGRQKVLCEEVSSCNKYAKVGQATTQCTDMVDYPDTYRKILSKDLYVSRDTTFKGMDYSGDSIYNQYQASDLRGVNVGTEENPSRALVFIDDRCFNADGTTKSSCGADSPGYCDSDINGSSCGDRGKCYNNICVTNFRGDPFVPGTVLTLDPSNAETASCRAYPEQSSPFPTTVAKWDAASQNILSKKPGFTGANVCEKQKVCGNASDTPGKLCLSDIDCPGGTSNDCVVEIPNACDCSYKKVSYSGGAVIKYFSQKTENFSKVCVGGPTPGKICSDPDGTEIVGACGGPTSGGGQCVVHQREDTVLGWQGYCLERDASNSINGDPKKFACLTWYPIDQLPGTPDLRNQYEEAGFELGEKFYCLKPSAYMDLQTHPTPDSSPYCAELSDTNWSTTESCEGDLDEALNKCLIPAINMAVAGRTGPAAPGTWGEDTETEPIRCSKEEWIVMATCSEELCDDWANDEDCPYKCIPKNSFHTTSGSEGVPCSLSRLFPSDHKTGNHLGYNYLITTRNSIREWEGSENTANDDCVKEGALWADPKYKRVNVSLPNPYLGCEEAVRVGATEENRAWTDRLWQGTAERPPYYRVNTTEEILRYGFLSPPEPFGGININLDKLVNLPFCRNDGSADILKLLSDPLGPNTAPPNDCPADYFLVGGLADANEGRPYMLIETERATGERCTTSADCLGNAGISCGSYLCYPTCRRTPTVIGSCPEGYGSCPTTDYGILRCPVPNRGITSASDCAAWIPATAWVGTCSGGGGSGFSCSADEVCYDFWCTSGECVLRDRSGASPTVRGETDFSLGIARLRQIFAKSFAEGSNYGKYWDDDRGGSYIDSDRGRWNITDKPADLTPPEGWPSPPQIWPITNCVGDKCVPLTEVGRTPVNGVTVGGVSGFGFTSTGATEPINVVGYGGQLRATLQFFGTADKNTGPIRNVIVDWNDGRGFGGNNPGRYKNYLGREACDNSDFAHSTDACTEDYFYFTHTYTCNRGSLPRPCLDPLTDSHCFAQDSCPENVNAGVEGNGSCCVFKPRVQLKDNWGWCNGTCPGPPGPTSNGCYATECDPGSDFDHWTYFAGRVIVVPK